MNITQLLNQLPGAAAQGLIWGIMAIGVYITFRILDIADLTVDGSFSTGSAVTVVLILAGWPAWAALLAAIVAGMLAGLITGIVWGLTFVSSKALLAAFTPFEILIGRFSIAFLALICVRPRILRLRPGIGPE